MIFKQYSRESSIRSILSGVGIYVLFFALVMLAGLFCMRAFISTYYYCEITGTSMQPTINKDIVGENSQDGVLVKATKDIHRNDIVIIDEGLKYDPVEDKQVRQTIIKRVIAMDGDAITILLDDFSQDADGYYHTYIIDSKNNYAERLDESYIAPEDLISWKTTSGRAPRQDSTSHNTTFKYEGLIYDNYLAKYSGSALENTKIVVRNIDYVDKNGTKQSRPALFYQLDEDEIFYMGDHRSVSSDARDTLRRTTVKREKINGKVVWYIPDAVQKGKDGSLWWVKIESLFSYFWQEISGFFAW